MFVLHSCFGLDSGLVLDLYCGTGSFGCAAPLFNRSAILVDSDPVMVSAAGQLAVTYLSSAAVPIVAKKVDNYFADRCKWQRACQGGVPRVAASKQEPPKSPPKEEPLADPVPAPGTQPVIAPPGDVEEPQPQKEAY